MTQKTWFITGINSGFGRVITELLLQRGDRVAGTARKLGQLDDLKKRYSEQLWVTSLDVTDDPAIRKAVDAAFQHFGRIDVILNNAGYPSPPCLHGYLKSILNREQPQNKAARK
jgi:NADP-dependent 3-hydroxy acid dehydrogenase YdfG